MSVRISLTEDRVVEPGDFIDIACDSSENPMVIELITDMAEGLSSELEAQRASMREAIRKKFLKGGVNLDDDPLPIPDELKNVALVMKQREAEEVVKNVSPVRSGGVFDDVEEADDPDRED